MEKENNEIILEINVRYDQALEGIERYRQEIARTKKDQEQFKEELKKGELTQREYNKMMSESNAVIKQRQSDIRTLDKELQNNIKQENALSGSYIELSAQMSILKNRYKELSAEQRKGQEGDILIKQINSLNDELKEADAAVGVFSRDVGNYQNAIISAASGGNAFAQSLLMTASSETTATGSTKALTGAINQAGTALKALLANPVVLVISAIVGVVTLLSQAFKRNEENGNKLNVLFQKLSSAFQLLLKAIEPVSTFLVDVFISAMEGLGNVVTWVIDKLGDLAGFLGFDKASEGIKGVSNQMREMSKNAEDLAKAEARLAKEEREAEKIRLDYQKQAEDLRQLRDDESKSIEERIKANERLGHVLDEQANRELEIAKLAVTSAQARINIYGETTENLDALAQAQTRVSEIEERINSQRSEQLANLNSLRKESIELQKQQRETELNLIRQAQESAIALLEEGAEKQRIIINNNYDKQISELKARLKNEKNLTQTARTQIKTIIINLEKQRQKELDKISQEEIDNAISREQTRIQNLLSAVKSGSQQEFDLRLQQIGLQRKAEIEANSRLAENMRQSEAEINAKYDKQMADARMANAKAVAQKQSEELKLEWENRILQVRQGSEEELQLRIQQAQSEYDALLNMDAEQKAAMFESDEAYTNAVLQNKNKIAEAEKNYNDNLQQSMQTQLQAYQAIGGGLESVLEAFAEDNEAMAEFSKAIALFNVGLATAEAIANGVAQAASAGPPPFNIIAIAGTIATVLANIAKAKQILSKETTPKAPKFSTGGSVVGAGSGTSDSIGARLSNGESVMTALTTSMFSPILSQLNQMGGGVPINVAETSKQVLGEDMLANAFAKGMRLIPKPIVGVDEITNVTKRVNVVETMGNS